MLEDLGPRQLDILNFIKKQLLKKGYPPSVREIGKAVGLSSSSTVHAHLSYLESKGYIRRDPTKPRAIELIDEYHANFPKKEITNIPIVGKITAGEPILATENIEDIFPLPLDFTGHGEFFILNVSGDSMIEAGINDGDFVIIRKQNHAQNGDIIAALLDEEATIKRFYKEKEWIRLQPENSSMDPIIIHEVSILGKVVGLFRKIY
ncbi:MAG: transcriptional repressor LexA [Bacillota bacterium]